MERAKWNGREYTASEVADDFEMEHAIRQISGRELFCPDPQKGLGITVRRYKKEYWITRNKYQK